MIAVIDELFFGATRVEIIEGRPLEHLSDGMYTSANAQGVMVAGVAAEIRRAAGAEVERELRASGALQVGQAYVTGPGQLAECGVRAIAHGVVVARTGESATLDTSMRALLSGLQLLEGAGCRSVTVPQIGWRVATLEPDTAAAALGNVVISHLRRRSRLVEISIVGTHRPYLEAIAAACRRQVDLSQ